MHMTAWAAVVGSRREWPWLMDHLKFRSQIEVLLVVDKGRWREWTDVEKAWIIDESLQGFLQCAATARRFEISRVLRMRWCRDFRVGWGICLRKIDSGTG